LSARSYIFLSREWFPESTMLEEFSKQWTFWLAGGIELCAGLLVGLAALQATALALRVFFFSPTPGAGAEQVRLNLGRWLALALEFELAADILRTAVAPTWNEIGQLAAIIVLRTALNFFLQREIDYASDRAQHVEP
jgi:uncharacterized membrane protein